MCEMYLCNTLMVTAKKAQMLSDFIEEIKVGWKKTH